MAWILLLLVPCCQWSPQDSTQPYLGVRIVDDQLAGPGAGRFLEICRDSRYVLFGEQHGVAGVAEFVAATQRALVKDGYTCFVRESGSWFASQLATREPMEVLREFPYSLAFDFDGDVDQLVQTGRLVPPSRSRVVGVDQELTLIHPLQFLSRSAPTLRARRTARGLFLKAALQAGQYVRHDHANDLHRLNEMVADDAEATEIVTAMLTSMHIFVQHIAGDRNRSVREREQLMKDMWDSALDSIPAETGVVAKMGGAHLLKGNIPGLAEPTLGAHIRQSAERKRESSLHIGIRSWTSDSALPVPESLRSFPYVLVQSKILRQQLGEQGGLDAELDQQLEQFDVFVLRLNGDAATNGIVRGFERRFVRGLLGQLGLILIPVLLIAVPWGYSAWRAIRRLFRRSGVDTAGNHTAILGVSAGLILLILVQFVLLIKFPQYAVPNSDITNWILDLFITAAIAWLVYLEFSKGPEPVSANGRIRGASGVLGCLGLACFVCYWNLGGMLGI